MHDLEAAILVGKHIHGDRGVVGEPSSMQIASKSVSVCPAIDSRHCCKYFSVLYIGMIIEISGVMIPGSLYRIFVGFADGPFC